MGPIPLERGAKGRGPDTGRGEVRDTSKSARSECRGLSFAEGDARFATHSPDGKPIERGPQQCEAAEYDLAPRPEGRQLLEIETAVDAIRNFGREHLGMGPNGEPSLIASILFERELAPSAV